MNLVLESRFISFAVRISDARKRRDDDQDEVESGSGGQFEALPFGYGSTVNYEQLGEGFEDE